MKKISLAILGLAALALVGFVGVRALRGERLLALASAASAPQVQTLSATGVYSTSATLQGNANNSQGSMGRMWFEYGTSAGSLTEKTGQRFMWSLYSYPAKMLVAGLSPNTTYYFRLVAENDGGRTNGPVMQFTTPASGVAPVAYECADHTTLTKDEMWTAWNDGKIHAFIDIQGGKAVGKVINNTNCALPISQVTYKMFDRNLASQQWFDYAPDGSATVTVPAWGSHTLETDLPSCMSQTDIYIGEGPKQLTNDNAWGNYTIFWGFNMNTGARWTNDPRGVRDAAGTFCTPAPQPATLKLVKNVVNNNGGTKVPADFALYMDSTQVTTGEVKTFAFASAGETRTVTASETNLPGYTSGSWGGDCAADGKVVLHPGDNKTCTITNDDNPQTLACANGTTLSLDEAKQAIYDGKIKITLGIDTGAMKATSSVANLTGCALPVSLSTYKMYDQVLSHQVLFDKDPEASPYYYTVAAGATQNLSADIASCMTQADVWYGAPINPLNDAGNPTVLKATIYGMTGGTSYYNAQGNFCTNQPANATLTLVKQVTNDNGGTRTPADFALYMDSTRVNTGEAKTFSFSNANDSKTITVSEINLPGYEAGSWTGACSSSLQGDVNKDGHVSQVDLDILKAAYNTTSGHAGYDARADLNNDGAVDFGDLAVLAQNFGTNIGTSSALADKGDANGDGIVNDADRTILTATYNKSQGQSGYDARADFNNDNKVDFGDLAILAQNYENYMPMANVTLRPGEHKTCTIVNNDIPQTGCIAVRKEAYTSTGSRITPVPQFQFKIDNGQPFAIDANGEATVANVSLGNHTVTEVSQNGWTLTSVVPANGVVNVGAGSGCAVVTFKNTQQAVVPDVGGSCVGSPSTVNTGQTVTWTATATGGDGSYTYAWTGDNSLGGTAAATSTSYSTAGTKNAQVVISSAGKSVTKTCSVVVTVPTATLEGSCVASKSSAYPNENITWSAYATGGTGSYTYAWSGDNSLGGTASATTTSYSSTGAKNAQVVITSGGQSITRTCTTNIVDRPVSGFALYCTASVSSTQINNSVTWTAYPSGGSGSYVYSWSGTSGLSGTGASTTMSYNLRGQKDATVTVVSGGETKTATCITSIYEPTSGCTGTCGSTGGGTVTVTREPGGRVAGVFLSQVPYTGVGSNTRVALFMVALFAWSTWLSYLFVRRKARKNGVPLSQVFTGPRPMGPSLAFAGAPAPMPTVDPRLAGMKARASGSIPVVPNIKLENITVTPHEPKPAAPVRSPFVAAPAPVREPQAPVRNFDPIPTVEEEQAPASFVPQIAKPQAEIMIPSSKETVMEALEAKARELATIVSADGLDAIAKAAGNNKHNATIILQHLVELYKGIEHEVDGEWMVLSADKINKILFSTYMTMTPVFVEWLAVGDDKKALAFVRMLQMQGQAVKDFVMNLVIELDKAYRFRSERHGEADPVILDSTMKWSNEELEHAIHTLVTAVDQTYSSVYASVKIALVKVLNVSKSKRMLA